MAQAITVALQFASAIVLARYLTPQQMGIYAVAAAMVALLSLVQQLGLNSLIVREEVLSKELASTAFTINAFISCALSLLVVGASYGGATLLGDDGVRRVLLVLALTPLIGIPAFLPGAYLERTVRFKELALISTAGGTVSATVAITMAISGFSFMSAAYAQVASAIVSSLLLIMVGRQHFSLRLGFSAWRRVAKFGGQILAISGISTASQRLSEVILGRILGLSALGHYNRASALNNLISTNFHLAISRVLLVDFSGYNRRGQSLRDRYIHIVSIITGILWPAFAGLAMVAEPLIILLYGERWLPALAPFVWLAIASIILTSITMTWELFTATGRLKTQTKIEAIRAIISLVLFVAACTISLEAAAFSRVLEAIISVAIYRPYLNVMTDTTQKDFWPIYAQSALLTLLAILPALSLKLWVSAVSPSLYLLCAVVPGVMIWSAGLFIFGHPIAELILVTIKRMHARWIDG